MNNTEIQVNEFVRTIDGRIAKLIGIYNNGEKDEIYDFDVLDNRIQKKDLVKSHSFNIIDLIEIGDYVNGSFIIGAAKDCVDDEGIPIILAENYDEWSDNGVIYNEDIKTIVTHEQFKAMEYKVGGENNG